MSADDVRRVFDEAMFAAIDWSAVAADYLSDVGVRRPPSESSLTPADVDDAVRRLLTDGETPKEIKRRLRKLRLDLLESPTGDALDLIREEVRRIEPLLGSARPSATEARAAADRRAEIEALRGAIREIILDRDNAFDKKRLVLGLIRDKLKP